MPDEVTMVSVQHVASHLVLGSDSTVFILGQAGENCRVLRRHSLPCSHPLFGVIQVAMGFARAAALRADSTVWVWGGGVFGQLGNGQMGPGTLSLSPIQVPGLTGIVSIATGGYHTCTSSQHPLARA